MTKSEIRVFERGSICVDAISFNGINTKARSPIRGWGTSRSSSSITLFPYNKISTSNVLGPQRMSLTRCNRCSVLSNI